MNAIEIAVKATDETKAGFTSATTNAEKLGKASEGVGSKMKLVAAAAGGLAGGALGLFLKSSVDAASDLNETMSKSSVIFGDSAGEISSWGDTAATSLGLSKNAAVSSAAAFGDMFLQLGIGQKQATSMSKQVVQMAADLGSFSNLDTADVVERLTGAFRGEYDSLQAVIPNISAARVETEAMSASGKKNAAELTAQEKATAVLAIVQKDGARASGDFARTSSGLANSQKILAAEMENAKAKIGAGLLPIMTALTHIIADYLIPTLLSLFDVVGKVFGFIKSNQPVFQGLAVVVGVLTVAMVANAVATRVSSGVFTAWIAQARAAVGASRLLAVAMGPIGVVATVAGAAIAIFASMNDDSADAADRNKGKIESLTSALKDSKGAYDESIRAKVVDDLLTTDVMETARSYGLTINDLTDAVLGNAAAQKKVADNAKVVGDKYVPYRIKEESDALGEATEKYRLYAEGTKAGAAGSKDAGAAAGDAAKATTRFKDATQDAADSAAEATQKMKDEGDAAGLLQQALDKLNGKTLDVAEAQTALDEATLNNTATLLKNYGAIGSNTEAGLDNQKAIQGQAREIQALQLANEKAGMPTAQATAKAKAQANQFLENIKNTYGAKSAIYAYAQELLKIPTQVPTTAEFNAAQALRDIEAFKRRLATVPKNVAYIPTVGGGAKPDLPQRAAGGAGGGETIVGEHGPERVHLPYGSVVSSNEDTMSGGGQGGGAIQSTLHITADADNATAQFIMTLMRSGKLQIKQEWVA